MSHIYTVSEITRNIRNLLENEFPEVWIEGEISNLSMPASGHIYFTLKDQNTEIKSVLYKFQKMSVNPAIPLKDGLSIIAFGKISVYEKQGQYQIIVSKWEPKGIGALQLAFEELKKKLQKEGLFDEKRKRPIPVFPQTVGVITSPTGAAIRDILNIIDRRFSNINIIIYPVRVQGQGSAQEIADAIDQMNQYPDIDVLIVGRGGGSLEDLWAFNEEVVARSIFRSKIPIISAVGHEIDYTISDFVADRRAPTPSAAAEMVIAQKSEFKDRIDFLNHKLQSRMDSYLQYLKSKLSRFTTSYVFKEPENTLQQYFQRVDELNHRLITKINHIYEIQNNKLCAIVSHLNALNPTSILNRGYSITINAKTGKIINNIDTLKKGETIETKLTNGRLKSIITEKTSEG
jgi:exodeoxyribonuclease VII large subunit